MKAKKRNIISFAICALFVAGLLAGSCYIKEGKQNAVVPVEGYNSKTQGEIKWAYDTVSGDSNSPAINVRIVGVYQKDGDTSKNITDDIIIPDKIPECENGKIIAYHKVESLGDADAKNKDSFFLGSFNVTSSGIVVDATACTGLKTVNDWAFSQDVYGTDEEGNFGKVKVYLPDTTEIIGEHCFALNTVYCNSPNITLKNAEDETLSGFRFFGPITTPENTLITTYKAKYRTSMPSTFPDPDKFPYIGAAAKEVTLHADAPDGGEVNRGGSGLKYDSVYVFEGKEDEKSRSFGNIYPPKKDHYVFEGYFEKNTQIFDKDGVLLKVPDGTDVYAKWTPEVYQVSFRNNQNTNVQNEEHSYQEVFSPNLPENFYPTVGYKLIRWEKYLMNANGEAVGEPEKLEPETTMTVDCNSIFKAILEPITYTVSFDANGGEVKDAELPNTFDKDYSLTTASRYGYTFDGWYTAKNGGTKVTEDTQMTRAENHTLYAHWTARTHKVVFDGNGATSGSMDDLDVTYDTKANPTCRFEKTGYSFTGWSYAKDGDVVDDLSGKVDTVIVYAIWKPNTYKVTFVTNSQSKTEHEFTYDAWEDFPYLYSKFYDFAGWVTDRTKTIPVTERETAVINYSSGKNKWDIAKDTTLYAAWYKKPSVTFNTKYSDTTAFLGDRELDKTNEVTYEYGEKISSLIMKCNTNRYIQSYRVETAGGTEVSAGTCEDKNSTVTIPFPSNYALKNNLKVYVEAANRTYGITYDTLGGEFVGEYPKTYSYGDEFDLPTNVKKKGFYVCGWRNTLNNKVITKIDADTSGPLALEAVYEGAIYRISVDLNGGTLPKGTEIPKEYKYKDDPIDLPRYMTKEGYSFAGWYCEELNGYVDIINPQNATDYHLKALWNPNNTIRPTNQIMALDGTETEIPYAEKPMESNQWYYNQLTDVEKKIYTTIYNYYKFDMDKGECKMKKIMFYATDKITNKNVMHASYAVYLDNPSMFWIFYFYGSGVKEVDGRYASGVLPLAAYNETAFKADALEYKGFFNGIISSLDKSGIQQASIKGKVQLIHDYVVNTYSYRNSTNILGAVCTDETRSIGYMMTHKEGCCVSYARMIKVLCDYYEIPCINVSSVDHMWNEIQVDGKWYLLDATWDDTEPIRYDYFLKGAKSVTDEHHKIETDYPVPVLSDDDYAEPTVPQPNVKPMPTQPNVKPIPAQPKAVTVTSATKGKVVYAISGKYAVVKKCTSKKAKSVTILNKVKIGKKTYTVTSIAKNAFKGCKKLKKVTIKAAKLKSIGKNAFKGIYKKATFKVPKKQLKKYKKLIQKKKTGFKKTMKVK